MVAHPVLPLLLTSSQFGKSEKVRNQRFISEHSSQSWELNLSFENGRSFSSSFASFTFLGIFCSHIHRKLPLISDLTTPSAGSGRSGRALRSDPVEDQSRRSTVQVGRRPRARASASQARERVRLPWMDSGNSSVVHTGNRLQQSQLVLRR